MKISSRILVPFIDVLFTFLLVFVSITMLINVKVNKENSEAYQQQNAIYMVVLNWEGNADLDLWMKDPMGRIVGFERREGGIGSLFSLNRDCLGAATTETGEDGKIVSRVNEEIVSLRGTFTGEYIVNVHSYDMRGSSSVKAKVKLVQNKPFKELKVIEKTFNSVGAEETFFRFVCDGQSKVTEYNDIPVSILADKMNNDPQSNFGPAMPFR
jgi:hypothetical protein